MGTWSLWTFGLLFVCLAATDGLNSFPQNFVVAKRDDPTGQVILPCVTQSSAAVTWMFDGDLLEDVELDGQNLVVSEVDAPTLGEYSCWRGEHKLSSTYLLLEAEDQEDFDSLVTCRAKSYDCNFSCVWKHSGYTAVRLGLGHDCSEGGKSCDWVSTSVRSVEGGLQFEMSHSLSPYAEESTMLQLTVESFSDLHILRRTKRFYLRDIVQPDSPQIVKCQEVEQELSVSIDPPSSWSTPHSFFSLEHQIEYVRKDDGKTGRSSSALVPKRISKLRVRSRDSLVLSAWSQWTPWKNVITRGKDLCKCKKRAKTCCPELPPGSLDHCKKRSKKKGKKNASHRQTS